MAMATAVLGPAEHLFAAVAAAQAGRGQGKQSGPGSPAHDVLAVQLDQLSKVAPAFWSRAAPEGGGSLNAAVQDLKERVGAVLPCLTSVESAAGAGVADARAQLLRIARAELFPQARADFLTRVEAEYAASLESHSMLHTLREEEPSIEAEARRVVVDQIAEEDADVDEEDAEQLSTAVEALRTLARFERTSAAVHDLRLLDAFVAPAGVKRIVDAAIDRHIEATYEGEFEERSLGSLRNWLDDVVIGWLRSMVPASDETRQAWLASWRARLQQRLQGALAELRTRELFDIIVDFPDSLPALEDLRECTVTAAQRSRVVTSVRQALQKRLLKPSTDTKMVINVYVLAIKALRALDSTGVMLDLVCAPVRAYLQRREDTIRCIITSLIDESNSELRIEQAEGRAIELADGDASDVEEDEDFGTWVPDPVDANPATSRSRRTADVTSMLITIYGSKELFVTEYQALLADRLLAQTDFNVTKETKHLELLKLRFGEDPMQQCEVMLKDFKDSKRIESNIKEKKAEKRARAAAVDDGEGAAENAAPPDSAGNADDPYRVFVLSRLFWPASSLALRGEDTLELPAAVKGAFKQYTEEFTALKAAQTLEFKPQLGTVSLSLELESGTLLEVKVTPMHATIIMLFGEQERWTLKDLSTRMQVSTTVLEKRILYWVHMGLIRPLSDEDGVAFVLDEDAYEAAQAQGGGVHDEPEAEEEHSAADARKQQQQDDCWNFVQGMLTNNGPSAAGTLHQTLGFLLDGYDWSEQDLVQFMNGKVAEGVLVQSGGDYCIVDEDA